MGQIFVAMNPRQIGTLPSDILLNQQNYSQCTVVTTHDSKVMIYKAEEVV